jgi:hypothetical protein
VKAIVVFHDHGDHWLDRFLKPGFKHCFVAVEADGHWITLDGRAGLPVVEIVAPADYDLATFYRSRGYAVVETKQRGRVPLMPFVPANCVGLVKGVLAIGAVLVLTPWQLYTHLTRAESPGFQLLPGGSEQAADRPGGATVTIERRKKATSFTDLNTGEKFGVTIDRRKKATKFEDRSPDANQRDGGKGPAGDQSGELGGGSTKSGPLKKDDERRGQRAAAILGSGAGSEGIRDKLGRSGRRGVGKSLG